MEHRRDDPTDLSPNILAERIHHERELRQQTEAFVNHALDLATRDYDRRLTSLGDRMEGRIEANGVRLDAVEAWRDQLTGKLVAGGVALGVAFTILGLVLDHVLLR